MKLLILVGLFWLACVSVCFRLSILHPISVVRYFFIDVYDHFAYNMKYRLEAGKLICYCAHFGGGKTLSVTEYITYLFNRYNNRYVYDRNAKKWLLQKVHILSNVAFTNIPYEDLVSFSQMVHYGERNRELDKENDTRTVTLVLIDEASTQLNSRSFKENFNMDTLNVLLTERHLLMSIFTTSQKFKLQDALLRSVTQTVISCKKVWRYMVQEYYDADQVELASDTSLIQPFKRSGFFVKDKHYNAYDTYALVSKLDKASRSGDMLSDEEILALRGQINPDNEAIMKPSRKMRKMLNRVK